MRVPFSRDIRALRDRFRREVRGALKMLLSSMPRSVAEWFVAELDKVVQEAESMLWETPRRRKIPPPRAVDDRYEMGNLCAICRHPQAVTLVRPYGHVCHSCDREYDAELQRWDEICQGRRAQR